MLYQINRAGQTYGPYTLADLKRYVESGHVLLNDMAKSDGMAEWVPVSHILSSPGIPPAAVPVPTVETAYAGGYAQEPVYAPMTQSQDPPNLHWGLVLLFDVITAKLFQMVWNLIISAWMKRVQPNSKAIIYYAAGYALGLIYTIMYLPGFLQRMQHIAGNDWAYRPHVAHQGFMVLIAFAAWVLKLLARFDMKTSLEQHFNTVEPIGLRMSGVMTFFFGGLYIQSQLNRINMIKQGMRYGQYAR